jgi:hypothetical protein
MVFHSYGDVKPTFIFTNCHLKFLKRRFVTLKWRFSVTKRRFRKMKQSLILAKEDVGIFFSTFAVVFNT